MRYTIGCQIEGKTPFLKKGNAHGIYAFGKYGFNFILSTENLDKKDLKDTFIYVSENIKDIEFIISVLSECYRRDDVAFSPKKKSDYIRQFYPVKIDSSNFPFLLGEKFKNTTVKDKSKKNKVNIDLFCLKNIKSDFLSKDNLSK